MATTEDYNKRAGFRIVTVWNTIHGGINTNVGNSFATNAVPARVDRAEHNGGLKIYQSELPAHSFACNYCWDEQSMKNAISSASKGWNKRSPRFILIQAHPGRA